MPDLDHDRDRDHDLDARIRLRVYRHFVESARALTPVELAAELCRP